MRDVWRKEDVLDVVRSAGAGNHQAGSLEPGTLWKRAQAAKIHALACGALKPIPAVHETVHDGGIAFTVWRLARADTQLPADRARPEKPTWSETDANPFLPYDADMFVSDLTDTHVCLLNKYNVLDMHLLLVTRAFEHQLRLLTVADFEALRLCMAEFEGLAFYNGGKIAGASQRHKHLQYVPFPLSPGETALPISSAEATAHWQDGIGTVDSFPFVHALGRPGANDEGAPPPAEILRDLYLRLLSVTGIQVTAEQNQSQPYNLLATREWMMVVPRRAESYRGISVNALGFAGSLLVRDQAQFSDMRAAGPLTVLSQVGVVRYPTRPSRV